MAIDKKHLFQSINNDYDLPSLGTDYTRNISPDVRIEKTIRIRTNKVVANSL